MERTNPYLPLLGRVLIGVPFILSETELLDCSVRDGPDPDRRVPAGADIPIGALHFHEADTGFEESLAGCARDKSSQGRARTVSCRVSGKRLPTSRP